MNQEQLDKLMETHPDLSGAGFYANWQQYGYYKSLAEYDENFKNRRQYLREHLDEVNASLEWLSRCPRRKTINMKYTSGYYKHYAEKIGDSLYVMEGCFIAAVLHLL